MIITRQFIFENRSRNGGWNFSQLVMLGEAWPPKQGWIDRAVGRDHSDEALQKFVEYGRQRPSRKERSVIKSGAANLPLF